MQRVLSTVTLLGLLVATAAAFAITEHLKLIKSPIYGTLVTKAFSPVCGCATDKASISVRLRHSDRLTVTIENSSRHTVATLASGVYRRKGRVTFLWNGHVAGGAVAPNGAYQPEIALANARRTILLPNKIEVDTTVPKVLSASDGTGTLVPGPQRTLTIRYAFSEDAHPVVYLNGRQIIRGRRTRTHSTIKWDGMRDGTPRPVGRYVLQIGALDLAGNETPASGRKQVVVRLRSIALSEPQIHVRAGARFTVGVRSVSATYTWRLGGRHGTGRGKVLRLHAPAHHGRYALVVVGANHHRATASVIVRRK